MVLGGHVYVFSFISLFSLFVPNSLWAMGPEKETLSSNERKAGMHLEKAANAVT